MKLFTKMVSSLKGYNSVLSKLGNDGKLAHWMFGWKDN